MKVDKKKVVATIGALGLTMGVLAGCGHHKDTKYVKVVDSQGHVQYIDEDDYDDGGSSFFILYSAWNGHNNTRLKPVSGFKHKVYSKKPTVTSGKNKTTTTKSTTSAKSSSSKTVSLTKSSSSAKSSGAKSSGFGSGRSGGFGG